MYRAAEVSEVVVGAEVEFVVIRYIMAGHMNSSSRLSLPFLLLTFENGSLT